MHRKRFVWLRLVVFSVSSFVSVSCVSPSVSTAHRASRADGFEHSLCPSRHGSSPLPSRATKTECTASALGFVTSTFELHRSFPFVVSGAVLLVEVIGLDDILNIYGSVQQLERSGVLFGKPRLKPHFAITGMHFLWTNLNLVVLRSTCCGCAFPVFVLQHELYHHLLFFTLTGTSRASTTTSCFACPLS